MGIVVPGKAVADKEKRACVVERVKKYLGWLMIQKLVVNSFKYINIIYLWTSPQTLMWRTFMHITKQTINLILSLCDLLSFLVIWWWHHTFPFFLCVFSFSFLFSILFRHSIFLFWQAIWLIFDVVSSTTCCRQPAHVRLRVLPLIYLTCSLFILSKIQIQYHYFMCCFIYVYLKSLRCNFFPRIQSTPYNRILTDKHKQLMIKKNRVCIWKPLNYLSCVSLIAPDISGKTDSPRFCNISIMPNPVPKRFGDRTIGTVGTTTVQNIDTHTPNKNTGIQGIILEARRVDEV